MTAFAVVLLAASWARAQDAQVSGKVEVIVEMAPRGASGHHHGEPRFHYRLKTDDGRYAMLEGPGLDSLRTGDRVRVAGSIAGALSSAAAGPAAGAATPLVAATSPLAFPSLTVRSLTVEPASTLRAAAAAASESRTLGRKTVSVIHPVKPGEPLSSPWKEGPESGVAAMYRTVSGGRIELDITHYDGWMPWENVIGCDYSPGFTGLPPEAENADYLAFDNAGCGCYAFVGGNTSTCPGGLSGHELGHNFGFHHANSWGCRSSAGEPVSVAASELCSSGAYGDPYDIMGHGGSDPLNAYHRHLVGWLDDVVDVKASGTFTLAPLGKPPGTRALRIVSSLYSFNRYWIEYFDGAGVQIRLAMHSRQGDSHLISDVWKEGSQWKSSKNWAPGRRFSDPTSKVFVTVLSTSAAGAVVQVQLGDAPQGDLKIEDLAVTELTGNAASVGWSTSELADSTVDYGPTAALASRAVDASPKTRHLLRLTGLAPSTTYLFKARSRAAGGSEASADGQFTTSGPSDSTPPEIRLVAPVAGAAVGGPTRLLVEASDAGGIERVEFYVNDALLKTVTPEP